MPEAGAGAPSPRARSCSPPLRILLIEDSRGDRRLVREYLGRDDPDAFAITEAGTLAEAFVQIKAGPIDLALLDLGLPDSWGLGTLTAVRAAAPHLPVVVFTGADDEEQALRAIRAGAQDYLVKGPLTKTAIQRTVRYTIERSRLEKALRESEEKFRTIADFTGDWEYWVQSDGTVVYMNPACRTITGYAPEEFSADPGLVERIVHPGDLEGFRAHHRQSVARGTTPPSAEYEFRIIRRDGQVRWISHFCHSVIGSDGSDRGWRVSNRDVTVRKNAEDAAAQQFVRLASLLEITHYCAQDIHDLLDFSLEQAILLTDSTAGCLSLYDDARQELSLSSWRCGDLKQCEAAEQQSRHKLAEVGLLGEAVRQGQSVVVNGFPASAPPGRGLPAGFPPLQRWLSVPVAHQGRIVAVIGLANKPEPYDDTDMLQLSLLMEGVWRVKSEREAVDEVRRLNAELEERVASRTAELSAAMRELEGFSYSVAHDLRAPLRSLDGFSQALQEEYAQRLDDTGKSYLARIRAASHRMATLIDDLLQLARVVRHPIVRTAVDLSALAREVVAGLRNGDPGREVAVAIEPGLTVQGDDHLLRVALDNLLGNAWKFTSRTPGARIEFGSRPVGDRREFFVRDNGAGFDKAYADKLFAAFQRLHANADFPGTGIGLTIVQRIVQRHGGEIRGEAHPGEGAVFTFTLEQSP